MDYTLKKSLTDDNSLAKYAELLSSVFVDTKKFTFDYLKWQYKLNPHGEVVGYDAYFNDELVAHYVTIPVLYLIHGKETKGLLSLNTATHKNHQGKGLFTKLATKTFEEGTNLGYKFVIGVANENSTPGFIKKLGFNLLTSLKVKTGTGYISYNTDGYTMKALWDKKSIAWRLNNPEANYFKDKKTIITKASSLGIYAQLHLFNNAQLIDVKNKKHPFTVWIGLANNIKNKGVFINLPEKLKPAPLNLIFRSLSTETPIPQKENLLFELIDFDIY